MQQFQSQLPIPIFDLKSSLSVGLNDDGNLDELVHLLGGCTSSYLPIPTDDGDDDDLSELGSGSDSTVVQRPHEIICPDVTDSNFIFDPKNHTDLIREGKSMPRPRYRHSTVGINGHIWVLGGKDVDGQVINEIDVYDSVREQWRTLSTGLDRIQVDDDDDDSHEYDDASDFCVFDVGSDLFIAGGFDSDFNALDHTIMIDTDASLASDTLVYHIKSQMNLPRGGCSAVSHGNLAFIVGGFTSEDGFCEAMTSVEIYDFMTDTWTEMEKNLMIGRANPGLFYYKSNVIAFGGETRGTFDLETGRCIDQFHIMDGLTVTMNRKTPHRLTFPITTKNIEILPLSHGHVDFSQPWKTKKTNLYNHGKVGFSLMSYPSIDSVFMFGGAWHNLDMIINSPSSGNCFTLSSDIELYINPLDAVDRFLNLVLILSLFVSFVLFVILMNRCRNKDNSGNGEGDTTKQKEHGGLIRNEHLWGGDVFSSDLYLEEQEWGKRTSMTNNVELKQIT